MPIHRENIARSHAAFSSFLEKFSRVGPYNGLDLDLCLANLSRPMVFKLFARSRIDQCTT